MELPPNTASQLGFKTAVGASNHSSKRWIEAHLLYALLGTEYPRHVQVSDDVVTVYLVLSVQGWIANRDLHCGRDCPILLHPPHSGADRVRRPCSVPIPGTGNLPTVAINPKVRLTCCAYVVFHASKLGACGCMQ